MNYPGKATIGIEMNFPTYTEKMQARRILAREKFQELLAGHEEFRIAASRVGEEYIDLLEIRWRTLHANLVRDQRYGDYCTSVVELCHRFGIGSVRWAPEAIHHVIARIATSQPTHHQMIFYYDSEPSNRRAKSPYRLRLQIELAFMRIVRGMNDFEIWDRYPEIDHAYIRQLISRGAKELGISLN